MTAHPDRHFDIAIVGSGSGNTILDSRFDGLRTAIVESGTFGGTCLNVGCIPTKMFVYAADVAQAARDSGRYGIDAHLDSVRWPDIVTRVFGRIDPISAAGESYRRDGSANTTLFTGRARFTGPRTLQIGSGETITADQIVLASGSRPVVPDEVLDSGVQYHTNDDVMRLPGLPRRLVILGSGFIAAEFAHVFSAMGTDVAIVGRSDQILRHLDDEVSVRFTDIAREKWELHLGHGVEKVDGRDGEVELRLADGTSVCGDALLVAVGRTPNGDLLNAGAGGVELDSAGRVVVDEFQRTTAEGVFALGDVSSQHMLKHVANHEARVVAHNLLAGRRRAGTSEFRSADHRFVPSAVFTHPQIATVGLTERQARARYGDVAVAVQSYSDVAYGWAMEDHEGFCKVIADRSTGRLLGAHLMGAQASTLIQPLTQAMSFGVDAADMARGQYWIHPALTEVVENALLALDL